MKLASQMPPINTMVRGEREIITGSKLIENGITTVKGEAVVAERNYMGSHRVEVPLNHNRKMKQAFAKGGMKGVATYANAVLQYTQPKPAAQP